VTRKSPRIYFLFWPASGKTRSPLPAALLRPLLACRRPYFPLLRICYHQISHPDPKSSVASAAWANPGLADSRGGEGEHCDFLRLQQPAPLGPGPAAAGLSSAARFRPPSSAWPRIRTRPGAGWRTHADAVSVVG
jgi:hypothetical protein